MAMTQQGSYPLPHQLLVEAGARKASPPPGLMAPTMAPPPGLAPVHPWRQHQQQQDSRVLCPMPPPPGLADLLPTGHSARQVDTGDATRMGLEPRPMREVSKESTGSSRSGFAAAPMAPIDRNVTTLVVQNLPGRYTQEDVLKLWPLDGTFDYLHVPYNLLQKRPLGYVFVNFLSSELAAAFQRKWHGKVLPGGHGQARKPLEVGAAEVQGRRANLQLIKSRKISQLSKAGFLPLVLEHGVRLDAKAILAGQVAPPKAPVVEHAEVRKLGSCSDSEETTASGLEVCACDSFVDDASSSEAGGDLPAVSPMEPMYVRLNL